MTIERPLKRICLSEEDVSLLPTIEGAYLNYDDFTTSSFYNFDAPWERQHVAAMQIQRAWKRSIKDKQLLFPKDIIPSLEHDLFIKPSPNELTLLARVICRFFNDLDPELLGFSKNTPINNLLDAGSSITISYDLPPVETKTKIILEKNLNYAHIQLLLPKRGVKRGAFKIVEESISYLVNLVTKEISSYPSVFVTSNCDQMINRGECLSEGLPGRTTPLTPYSPNCITQLPSPTYFAEQPWYNANLLEVSQTECIATGIDKKCYIDLNLKDFLSYLLNAAKTLREYHAQGKGHFDIKPDNILLSVSKDHTINSFW